MKALHCALVSFGLLGSFGCSLPQRATKVIELPENKSSVVTYSAELRGAYIRAPNAKFEICAEPAPDVALESVEKITASLKGILQTGQTVEGSLSTELATKVVQLAGRTQLVLLAREMLFRACELSLNNDVKPDTVVHLYTVAADLVKDLGAADKIRAKADLTKASEAAKKAGITIDKILNE
ncbi:MAG: hypothetical protein AABZ34_02790 [Nitrospirota bacterium]